MNKAQRLCLPVIIFLPLACSQQQVYDGIQENRRQECQNVPQSMYEECIEKYSEPYDEYQRQRQEILEASETETPSH